MGLAGVLLAATAVWAIVTATRNETKTLATPWNVLLVSVDTLRADHLSSYGGEVPTPHMDRLAREGVRFERVQSVAPTTLPSHASLFTARAPDAHGVRDNVGFYLPEGADTLASRLAAAGYRTGGFVGAFVLDSRFGVAQGFEHYFDAFDALADTDDVSEGFVSQRPGGEVLARALSWLDDVRAGPAPFFAFVHFYDPHTPYAPPAPFDAGAGDDPSARYRGEVAYTDSLVGELLAFLDESNLARETLVVLTSDHGESLGEHGERTHGFFVYESTLRVPLLLRYPGAPAGARVPAFVRLVDVAPTILDRLGLPPFEGAEGVSLVPLIENPESDWERPHYAETYFPRLHFGFSELVSLRRGAHKLILAPRPELYDLEEDPGETRNRIEELPDVARRLRRELAERRAAGAEREVSRLDVDPETRARLESLGYAGSGAAPTVPKDRADPKDRVELYGLLNDPLLASVEPGDGPAFADALARVERVVREEDTIPRAYVLYGELLLKAGRLREAEAVFDELAGLVPGSFEARYGLGVVRQRRGDGPGAESAFREALAIEPRNTKSYFRLSELAAARGDLEAAEGWLRDAVGLSPNRFLRERLANVLLEGGKREEARAILDAIVREHGSDPIAVYNLGQTLLVEGDAAGALEMFRMAEETSPDDADVQQGLGNARAALGDLAGAVAAYRRAIDLSPCFAAAYGNLGMALQQLGRSREAVAAMSRAVECDPDYVLGYKNLAALHVEAGRVRAAIESLERAQRAAPEDAELSRHLAELRAYERQRP